MTRRSKADLIYESLLEKITRGEWRVGDRLPTEKELAAEYEVAVLTLRKSLKRLRDEGWIASQRYHGTTVADPAAASELKCKLNKGVIGLVLPMTAEAFLHPVFTRLVNGVEGVLSESGYALEAVVSNPTLKAQEEVLLKKLRDPNIQGWLIPARISEEAQKIVRQSEKPKVALHSLNQSLTEHCFLVDHTELTHLVLQHLYEQGYHRICTIHTMASGYWAHQMVEISRSPAAPGAFEIQTVCAEGFGMEAGQAAAASVLENGRVDAFVCADDDLALGVLNALQQFGLSAPEVGVIGGGDFPIGTLTRPTLTTISYPYYQVGREAARILIDLIEGKPVEVVTRRFGTTLVVRESSCVRTLSDQSKRSSFPGGPSTP